ncbi:MAG: hypothetical protein ACD_7C00072G0001, partial [uncultured bacterium]
MATAYKPDQNPKPDDPASTNDVSKISEVFKRTALPTLKPNPELSSSENEDEKQLIQEIYYELWRQPTIPAYPLTTKEGIKIRKYQSSSNKELTILQQVEHNKCGISCALMLAFDSSLRCPNVNFREIHSTLTGWFFNCIEKDVSFFYRTLEIHQFSPFVLRLFKKNHLPSEVCEIDKTTCIIYDS